MQAVTNRQLVGIPISGGKGVLTKTLNRDKKYYKRFNLWSICQEHIKIININASDNRTPKYITKN